jgi:hypothetical protein
MDDLAPVLALTMFMLAAAWMLRTLLNAFRHSRLIRAQAELQNRLIDKLGGSEEMIRYLESGPGRQLLEAPQLERTRPYARILASLQAGTILLLAGAAFFVIRGQLPEEPADGFVVLGTLGMALGVGFLLSGGLAWLLSRSWGLIDGRGEEGS